MRKLFIACLLAGALVMLFRSDRLQASEGPASWSEDQLRTYIDQRVQQAVDIAVKKAFAERQTATAAPTYRMVCENGVCRMVAVGPTQAAGVCAMCGTPGCNCTTTGSGANCPMGHVCTTSANGATYTYTTTSGDESVSEDSSGGGRRGPIRRLIQRFRNRRGGGGSGGNGGCGGGG